MGPRGIESVRFLSIITQQKDIATMALGKFLTVQAFISAAINLSLNAALAVVLFRGIEPVPVWGNPGVALDTLGVAFFLPLLTVLIVAPFAAAERSKGSVDILKEDLSRIRWLRLMPKGLFSQSLLIPALTVVFITPVAIGTLHYLKIDSLSNFSFVIYKSALATALSFPVSPVVWMSAMKKHL